MNPTLYLKVPQGLYCNAVKKGLKNQVIVWYYLKKDNIEGFLKRGKIVKTIQSSTKLSESSVRRYLKELENLKWISRQKNGSVSLVNYDTVWNCLGINKTVGDNLFIFRIKSDVIDLSSEIICKEIEFNQHCQRSLISSKGFEDTEEMPSKNQVDKARRRVLESRELTTEILLSQKKILKKTTSITNCNTRVELSCKTLANKLGYKSAMQGTLIQRKLESLNMVKVTRQVYWIASTYGQNIENLPTGFFIKKGELFLQFCNKLEVNATNKAY